MENSSIIYAARLKDRKQLYRSSSGGMFTAISDFFLAEGSAVICTRYCYETNILNFVLCTSIEQREEAIGSKYMQSTLGDIFKESVKWLEEHAERNIVFFGVGCQSAAYRKYMDIMGYSGRVYVVDIVCHGVPSPLIWKEYLSYRFSEKKLDFVTFKDKRNGWLHPTALVRLENQEVLIPEYVRLFYNRCILRPSCAKCPYATTVRSVDMTIGDFWNIEKTIPDFYDEMGTSVVIVHTEKGRQLFSEISNKLDYRLSNEEECWQPNLEHPTIFSPNRKKFWYEYQMRGFKYIYKKYATDNLLAKIKRKILG